jgi:hypothetical protein
MATGRDGHASWACLPATRSTNAAQRPARHALLSRQLITSANMQMPTATSLVRHAPARRHPPHLPTESSFTPLATATSLCLASSLHLCTRSHTASNEAPPLQRSTSGQDSMANGRSAVGSLPLLPALQWAAAGSRHCRGGSLPLGQPLLTNLKEPQTRSFNTSLLATRDACPPTHSQCSAVSHARPCPPRARPPKLHHPCSALRAPARAARTSAAASWATAAAAPARTPR